MARPQEVVFEYTPEPHVASHARGAGQSTPFSSAQTRSSQETVDASSASAREAFAVFSGKESRAEIAGPVWRSRTEHEYLGESAGLRDFEPPEQRLARLQGEVADLLRVAEGAAALSEGDPSDVFGADPAAVSAELKILEQRLGGLARDGPSVWSGQPGAALEVTGASQGSYAMSQSLTRQLERMGAGSAAESAPPADGRVTYEVNYSPSTEALASGAKIAALEGNIAEIERRLGTLDPACPFTDVQTAVVQLQKRLSLLDPAKIDAIHRKIAQVKGDVEELLKKKGDLQGNGADGNLDQKVNELYEFCHRWNSTAGTLPAVVARLRSLQVLHQQSASFSSRLSSLEQQQDEIVKMLETTSFAVKELGTSFQENMTIVKDNMSSLEDKMKTISR